MTSGRRSMKRMGRAIRRIPRLKDVYSMRAMFRRGVPVSAIAREFGVGMHYVYDISKRTSYVVRIDLPVIIPTNREKKSAKLTEQVAQDIYNEYMAGKLTQMELARKYGVSPTAIYNIRNSITFKRIKR